MTAAGMRLQILRDVLDSPEQRVRLDELEQTIKLALDRLRQLITELQPPPLDREGIVDALRAYVSTLVQATGGDYEVESLLGNEPPTPTRLIIYRVTQEALRHLGRDAGAARLSVTIAEDGGGYRVSVVVERAADDRGGPLHRRLADAIAPARERVEIAGGWLRTTDERPERPTVEFWVPVVADPAEHAR
jgi:signal transduction histidine kinase